ncbi:hypothetical protein J7E83_17695 [Arthrobacter sp. ISL-48]|uniref:hypothetical protein n=1 Tax=Arthrobacter sp. ISL-48 TaxID=2819110 RepID=UPI001BEA579B|nr:hypothetical protein [Arthrobacter sp. ISL-48]MBT2533924.1 hypothetical protein [Arthrobacter sp. ISL-48]
MHPLVSAIHDIANYDPGKAAIRWRCNDFPYAALDRLIHTRALAMQLKGIRAGELVAFDAVPGPETMVDAAALWALGAAALPFRSTPEEPLPAHAILKGVTGFMHPEGDYIKAATMSGAPSGHTSPAASLWLHQRAGRPATPMNEQQFIAILETAEKRFTLSTRTSLALTSVVHPESLLDSWAVLAAGGTVDLLNDYDNLHDHCLLQHLRETEADLLIVPSTLPQRLGDSSGALFAQFRDIIVTELLDELSRTVLADAFPCAIFHQWDTTTGVEAMNDNCPADFVAGSDHFYHHDPKDPHA